jgi:REP element-mobilizing transposase RayT
MPQRILNLEQDVFYHAYNRGFNEQQLFFEKKDYERFMSSIKRYLLEIKSIEIPYFSILPNHFHFLIRSTESGLDISNFMRKLQQSYAMYFNKKYGEKIKSGLKYPVFEGRFQTRVIEKENYLEKVQAYIELNPVKHDLVADIKDWPYSSFHTPLSPSPDSKIVFMLLFNF